MSTSEFKSSERKVVCAAASGLHDMVYSEWGEHDNPDVLVCVHGLTRNGHDFDDLAHALAADYRVICPDVVGRGRSEWLADSAGYAIPQYVADMVVLIARLDVEHVNWLGTSMGGLIGMALAGLDKTPIKRLLLNDVGPVIAAESIRRIGAYVGLAPKFKDFAEAEAYIRLVCTPFGALTDDQWRRLTASSLRQLPDGALTMGYDPRIGEGFRRDVTEDIDLWPIYERITCPTLLLRGAESDLLTHATAQAMAARGPRPEVVEVTGVGHAPMFMDAAQIGVVRRFLRTS
ncbi:MAG: alpha/beta hydrolase [Propionivibrio sp.]